MGTHQHQDDQRGALREPDKIEAEKKFDGIFVLRTNTDLNPLEAMLCYKQLWTVEQTFQTAKHLFSTRPIFHKLDETVRGHVFCSFLALVLKLELEERIAFARRRARLPAWPCGPQPPDHPQRKCSAQPPARLGIAVFVQLFSKPHCRRWV